MNLVYDQILGALHSVNDVISKIVTVSTVCSILEQCSDRENAKKACISFIVWRFEEVEKTEGWSRLNYTLKEEIQKKVSSLYPNSSTVNVLL
jgi:precorrin-6B methylase 2